MEYSTWNSMESLWKTSYVFSHVEFHGVYKIAHLPAGVFSPLAHLRTLNLRYNWLADIGPHVFHPLPRLHDLDLQVCRSKNQGVTDTRFAGVMGNADPSPASGLPMGGPV